MNAVESVNKAEGTGIKLSGTTKRFADAYNAAPEDKKQEAAEKFFRTDKVGKQ